MMTSRAWRANVHFVLVAPTEPGNIGAAARAIKNMGFANLELVNPVPYLTPEARAMACGAREVLEGARVHRSLKDAIADKSLVAGTTRRRGRRRGIILPASAAAEELAKAAALNKVAVLFGNEHNGLTNSELEACGLLVTIPSNPGCPSLNLSQSVMILAYELSRVAPSGDAVPMVGSREVQHLMKRARAALDILGYGKKGDRDLRADILRNLRRLVGRAGLTAWELNMLLGLCSQVSRKVGLARPKRPNPGRGGRK